MAELILRVPDDVRREFETVSGTEVSESALQLLFSRFLQEELREKLQKIKRIESIASRSKLTESQAKELADKSSISVAKRFLDSASARCSGEL